MQSPIGNNKKTPEISMFTSEDIGNIITFLSRVDLKGTEAPVLVGLVAKLNQAGQEAQAMEQQAAAEKAAQVPAPKAPAPIPAPVSPVAAAVSEVLAEGNGDVSGT